MTMTPSASLVIDELKFELRTATVVTNRNRETETSKQTNKDLL